MQPIKCNVILNSVRTRRDNSLGLSLETPELTNEAMLVFLRLRGINLDMTLEPMEQGAEVPLEVKAEIDAKTPSQRLRAVLYALFAHEKETGKTPKDELFEVFYARKVERIIEWLKTKLPEQ
jgi:hypothetical protein